MDRHDVQTFAGGLSSKLATRSRHVCVFLGAGAARACGLPDVGELEDRVVQELEKKASEAFQGQLSGRNIEQALTRLRRISVLLDGDTSQTIDGLTSERSKELDRLVCQAIVHQLDIGGADLKPMVNLAAWAARADYRSPVELFTVNYDLLIESALEKLRVPYFDGFIGSIRARFHTELVENRPGSREEHVPRFFVRLWKLHGSVNWEWEPGAQIVRLGQPVSEEVAAAIYPSDAKYEESRRVPFVVLQDRLRRALHEPETLVLLSGYSFGDDHLNEMLFDAATRRERSEFVVFCYADIPEMLAEKAVSAPNLQVVNKQEAVIGGVRLPWKPLENDLDDLWEGDELVLADFSHLSSYLARSATREAGQDFLLAQVLERLTGEGEKAAVEGG